MFSLTMLAFGILFFDGRDTDDAANVMVALGVGGQEAIHPERFQIGIGGEIISEWRAISFRNHGRFEIGMMGDFARNQQLGAAFAGIGEVCA
jgi:hypothetical protein